MAICSWCGHEMKTAKGCCENLVVDIGNIVYRSIPWDGDGRCPDCSVKPNHPHHPGCDQEECPKCGGQLIGCGCLDDEDADAA